MYPGLPRRFHVPDQAMRIQIPGQQDQLKKQQRRAPHGRRSSEPRQNESRDQGLYLEQQERAKENGRGVSQHANRLGYRNCGRGRANFTHVAQTSSVLFVRLPPATFMEAVTPAVLFPSRRYPHRTRTWRTHVAARDPGVSSSTPTPVPVDPHETRTRPWGNCFHPHWRRRCRRVIHASSASRRGQSSQTRDQH